jgi:hypothetical protein
VLVRVSNTPDINEVLPQAYTDTYVTYLSDKNGVFNRYLAEFDSTISFVDTTEHYRYYFKSAPVSNYDRNILEQNINPAGTHVAERFYSNGKDLLQVRELPRLADAKVREPVNTWYRGYISPAVIDPSEYKDIRQADNSAVQKPESSTKGIDFDNYRFEGEKEKPGNDQAKPGVSVKKDTIRKATPRQLKFPIPKNYSTAFYTDYVVTQFDNSFLGNNYQLFTNSGTPVYLNPGFNFVTKVGLSDLFEDMRIVGAFRLDPSLNNEYMLSWEQRRGRFDHQILVDRQTIGQVTDASNVTNKVNTHIARYSIKYPFSPVSAVRVSLLYRNDRKVALSKGDITLAMQNHYSSMGGTRLEYIFDNTRKVMLNIMNGLRAKVWTEYWLQTENGGGTLFTSGFDVRHYQKVHRQITWCNRIAGGNSLGSSRLLFYLGGVDNWFVPKFNNNVNIVHPEQYGYQTLATDMRGYYQNIRNGNNFLLYNSEMRIPIVRYLIDYPLRSDFLNNLQVIGFTDVGMAWYGSNPLSGENTENVKSYIQGDPYSSSGTGGSTGIIVTVIDNKNPLVGGMGFGFRSRLLGYFVRLDFGWGIDNWVVQKKVVGLSFTTDF